MSVYRPSPTLAPGAALRRTLVQMAVFWLIFLVVVPAALVALEDRAGHAHGAPRSVRAAGVTLLALASALGVWSACTMARSGRGTPLPTACAPRLVVSGPYAWVRNPMAVAGIAQGLGVGLALGSPATIAYALAGGPLWHVAVRPSEERDLAARFGAAYAAYRARVRCWIPRTAAYRPPVG